MDMFNETALNSLLKTAEVMQRGQPRDKRFYIGPDAERGGADRVPVDVKFDPQDMMAISRWDGFDAVKSVWTRNKNQK